MYMFRKPRTNIDLSLIGTKSIGQRIITGCEEDTVVTILIICIIRQLKYLLVVVTLRLTDLAGSRASKLIYTSHTCQIFR